MRNRAPARLNARLELHGQAPALRFRRAVPEDLPYCFALLPGGFRAPRRILAQVVKVWEQLLAREAARFAVIEDVAKPHPKNIEAFGVSVFVIDRFFEHACAAPQPHLSALFYERMLADEQILLTNRQIREANSGSGLNIVVLHFSIRDENFSDSRTMQALSAGSGAFSFFHAGFQIRAVLQEVYGLDEARHMQHSGFRLIRDFHAESPASLSAVLPVHRPYRFLLRREWSQPTAMIQPPSHLLHAPVPAFGFSSSERRLLESALLNESDALIAERLGASVDSVKKTWRNIYRRVELRMPALFPANESPRLGSRGQEKRRYLLNYLRIHLEELRPSATNSSSNDRR